MTWPRRLRTALFVLTISTIITTQVALAADPQQPTTPTGFGDLLPAPDLTHGDTRTLFEQYNPMAYSLDFEGSFSDPFRPVFNSFAQMLMLYIVAATRAAIAIGWWLFSFTDIRPLMDATSHAIGDVSTQLTGWLLPSALALGAIAAYVQRKSSGTALGQLVWVFAAALLAISLAVGPATWLKGVDGARQVGAQTVMGASGQVVGTTLKTPFEMPEPAFPGTARDTMLRKSGDAAWRGFAVTPWCIAEFGSLEACGRYGKGMLDTGIDGSQRMDYIKNDVAKGEGGGDAPTVKWAKGENPFGRIGVLIIAAVAASLFAFLNIGLAATALMAFVGCLVMLVVGVVFACLFIIPGRSRQWGMNWLEALLGLVLQSVAAMLVFGVALSLLTAVFGLSQSLGWLPVTGLALVVLIAAFRLRRLLESLTTMMRPGVGSMMMGSYARRGAVQAMRRVVTAIRSRGSAPSTAERQGERGKGSGKVDEAGGRVETNRVYRTMPTPGFGRGQQTDAQSDKSTSNSGRSAKAGEMTRPGIGGTVTRRPGDRRESAGQPGDVVAPVLGKAKPSSNRRSRDVYQGGTFEPSKPTVGSSKNSTERSSGRHAKASSAAAQLRQGHYEPRRHVHSASLREGPAKIARETRKPVGSQRRFREYSAARSSGPTSHRSPGGR
ncbi:hypothetical protein EV643_11574 [Kribbella sp. VKM Ac-2527]|uniref:TrbL/VirB6 plasmid conjugal transfer protein n=1 Tax=Kribbella caucasensis TaxID=2512215 RepID=A0A4R6K867_9ACTN|nr:hypothetical protein [Kribbella sp. VKM Ac-2527]TDO44574.1 hypothetical protein EV643_11574 [Kribbella sp. VKM Ac-2527]